MPSNQALIESIKEIDEEVEVDNLSNAQLAEKLAALKAEADGKPEYYVAPGKAITSLKGILSGDTEDEVRPEYLHGKDQKAALADLVKNGYVLKG